MEAHSRDTSEVIDSHQHHFSKTPVFVGCGVRAGSE